MFKNFHSIALLYNIIHLHLHLLCIFNFKFTLPPYDVPDPFIDNVTTLEMPSC